MAIKRREDSNIMVFARAGSGKTTLLKESVCRLFGSETRKGSDEQEKIWSELLKGGKVNKLHLAAFNVAMVNKLKEEIPPDGRLEITGVNALGRRILVNCGYAQGRDSFSYDKNMLMTLEHFNKRTFWDLNSEFPGIFKPLNKLLKLGKQSLLEMSKDTIEDDVAKIIRQYDVQVKEDLLEVILEALPAIVELSVKKATSLIDFDDMIWLPNRFNLMERVSASMQVDIMMADEFQDMSLAQQNIILAMARRYLLVGDDFQAIYGFSGAMPDSMHVAYRRLVDEHPINTKKMPLTVSWRCPLTVVAEAKKLVPDIKAAPNAKSGSVKYSRRFDLSALQGSNDLVICPFNAPVLNIAINMIAKGRPVNFTDTNSIEELEELIGTLSEQSGDSIESFMRAVDFWVDEAYQRKVVDEEIVHNKAEALKLLASSAGKVSDIPDCIKLLKVQDKTAPMLSTIHKAKGLEADNVYILDEDKCKPEAIGRKLDWVKQQTLNLRYVAITRSKNNLTLLHSTSEYKFSPPPEKPSEEGSKSCPKEKAKQTLESLNSEELEELAAQLESMKCQSTEEPTRKFPARKMSRKSSLR